jgi:hypothetical protein
MSQDTSNADRNQKPSHMSGGIVVGGSLTATDSIIAGRDVKLTGLDAQELDKLFAPLYEAIEQAPPDKKVEALEKAKQLEDEVAKGESADDSRTGKLVDGILELVPGAVSAVVAMFGQPILAGVVGPVTKFVLEKVQGK